MYFPKSSLSWQFPAKEQHNFNKIKIKFTPLCTVCGDADNLFEQNRLQLFGNRLLRGVGTRKEPVTGKWRKMRNGNAYIVSAHRLAGKRLDT